MTFISSQPAHAGSSGVAPSTADRPLPPPSKAKLLQAIQELSKQGWEVRCRIGDPSLVTACGPALDGLTMLPLPATTGSGMEYARKIIAQAVVKKAESLSPDMIEQIGANVQPEYPEQRDYEVLVACKAFIAADVMAIAQHGAFGLAGPQALLHFLGVEASDGESSTAPWAASSPATTCPPGDKMPSPVTPDTSGRRFVLSPPPKSELLRALKFVASSSLGLSVKLASAHPLKLELAPGHGFGKRFADTIRGPDKPGEAKPEANALVLRTLVDVVACVDMAGLRAWLPSIDAGMILDPSRSGEVLTAYQAELFGRTRQVIESAGHLGLRTFPELAYCGFNLGDL